jgi:hypothetical protein
MVSALDERAGDAVVENNTFIGPYTCPVAPQAMAILSAKNVRVVGNIVDFNGAPNGAFDPGLWISARSIAAGVISRNVFTGNSLGLRLSTALSRRRGIRPQSSRSMTSRETRRTPSTTTAPTPVFLPGPLFRWPRSCQSRVGATTGAAPARTATASTISTS